MRTRLVGTLLTAVLGASMLAACGGDDADTAAQATVVEGNDLQAVYEAAKKEGELVIYGPGEGLFSRVYEDFKAAYPGIEIKTSVLFGSDLDSRLSGEQVAGGFQVDLIHIGDSDLGRYKPEGWLGQLTPAGENLPKEIIGGDGSWVIPSRQLYGIMYNTDKVKADEAPKSWKDLTDPKWKDRVATGDFTVSSSTAQVLSAAYSEGFIDDAWLKSLADNVKPKVFPSTTAANDAVVTGEASLLLTAYHGSFLDRQKEKAPVGFVLPEEGAYVSDFPYSMVEGARHPNAARLLVSWLLTKEGQESIVTKANTLGVMPDAPLPGDAGSYGDFKKITFPGDEKYASAIETFGKFF
ncbi:ABC transporter substrate-binding protein [Nonomuraea wenchangensis]|uniref:ABC transporter substrate-binding protein n=1 Tax=Nonomuraea wenchangensis TaxID=568860 RepID=UPI0033189413